MPKLQIIEESEIESPGIATGRVDPRIGSQQFQALSERAGAVSQVGQDISEFAIKMQANRDFEAFHAQDHKITEGFNAKLREFETRNDFELFESEFEQTAEGIKKSIFAAGGLSRNVERRLDAQFQAQEAINRQRAFGIRDRKQLERSVATYNTRRQSLINAPDDGTKEEKLKELTNEAFQAGSIGAEQHQQDLIDNERQVDFVTVREMIDVTPDLDAEITETILSFPQFDNLSLADKDNLRRYAAAKITRVQQANTLKTETELVKAYANKDQDFVEIEELLNAGLDNQSLTPQSFASHHKKFRNEYEERNKTFAKKKTSEFKSDIINKKSSGNWNLENIEAGIDEHHNNFPDDFTADDAAKMKAEFRVLADAVPIEEAKARVRDLERRLRRKEVTLPVAETELLELMDTFDVSLPNEEIARTKTLLNDIRGGIATFKKDLRDTADQWIETNKGMFGEFGPISMSEMKEEREEFNIQQTKLLEKAIARKDQGAIASFFRDTSNELLQEMNQNRIEFQQKVKARQILVNDLEEKIDKFLELSDETTTAKDMETFLNEESQKPFGLQIFNNLVK